ncbi:aminotransferase class IV [Jiulongibacter sp. NS-SX5]|uniref:aminotransferase class IV n=1 Tax=Jiulongibacter sp. NS-SX5 TaxID=3463854 RepID=UPI0040591297
MSRYFETIKYQNGEFSLLELHEQRLNKTRSHFFAGKDQIRLSDYLQEAPDDHQLYRCRVSYDEEIREVKFIPYSLAHHTKIGFCEVGSFDYAFKSEDRAFFTERVSESGLDDLIFLRNGKLTDASYSNLALKDGDQWYTPKSCLLNGVKRQYLISKNILSEAEMTVQDLSSFTELAFINAMRDFELTYQFRFEEGILQLDPL